MLDGPLIPIGLRRRPCACDRAGEYAAGDVHPSAAWEPYAPGRRREYAAGNIRRGAAFKSYAPGRRREYAVYDAGPVCYASPIRYAAPVCYAGPVCYASPIRYTAPVCYASPIRNTGHSATCKPYDPGRAGNSARADSVRLFVGHMRGERRRVGRNPTYGPPIRTCIRSILVA